MRHPFRDHHISAFLESVGGSQKPLDLALGHYFRAHKSIGANDRRFIGETLYGMVRWKSLIDHFCASTYPQDRLAAFRKIPLEECLKDPSIPEPIRLGLSEFLYEKLYSAYGLAKTRLIGKALNGSAPPTVRANLIKTTREALLELWKGKFDVAPCSFAPQGIRFQKREPLFALPEFKEGLFEVQDEGSQLVSELVEAKPGDHILDYCSGSGGKTLAFAPSMKGKGQIYLHDIRPHILLEAKKRMKRAGVQNAQIMEPNHPRLSSLKGKMDWVLVDVPCTGTGTLRRNPDAKWKIDLFMLERLKKEQREIVEKAIAYLKPTGKLVYATCSILPEENQDQIDFFIQSHGLVLEKPPLSLLPEEGGSDGFFAAVLKKT